jgi:hypothetical protein
MTLLQERKLIPVTVTDIITFVTSSRSPAIVGITTTSHLMIVIDVAIILIIFILTPLSDDPPCSSFVANQLRHGYTQ